MTTKQAKKRPVVVTTEHRGVFFGYCEDVNADPMSLTDARLCIHWVADVQGFMGLASGGPTEKCLIGPKADIPALKKITSVLACTPEAEAAWLAAKWNG